jgi:hypothetical protein
MTRGLDPDAWEAIGDRARRLSHDGVADERDSVHADRREWGMRAWLDDLRAVGAWVGGAGVPPTVVPHHEYACDTDQDDEDGSDTGIEATPRLLALL